MIKFLSFFALALFLSILPVAAQTPSVEITSPDHAVIYAKSSLQQHALYWSKDRQQLSVTLHYSDNLYNDTTDSAADHDETFEFRIPGIIFDPKAGLFDVDDGRGNALPVARRRKVLFVSDIQPTPNAVFHIIRDDKERIGVVLTVYRPEIAAALQEMPQPEDKTVQVQSLFQK